MSDSQMESPENKIAFEKIIAAVEANSEYQKMLYNAYVYILDVIEKDQDQENTTNGQ